MNVKSFSSEGIVLASRNYHEADRIVIIFTKSYGKKAFLAKGVRKPKSKKRGGLEVFSQVKLSANVYKGFDILSEVEIIDTYPKIRKNLNKASLAYYFVEVLGRISSENEPNHEALVLLERFLTVLSERTDLKKLKSEFIKDILICYGYWEKDKVLENPDEYLNQVLEKNLNSVRVGKKILG